MGLFRCKSERTLDSGLKRARKSGQRVAGQASELVDDGSERLRGLIDDLESALGDSNVADSDTLRKTLRSKVESLRSSASSRGAALSRDLNDALGQADHLAREKPWQIVGGVAVAALLIGFLAGRS